MTRSDPKKHENQQSDVGVSKLPLSVLQQEMLDATPDCIKIITTDGKLIAMSRSGCHALGVEQNDVYGASWIPLLPDSVNDAAAEALNKAVSGHIARFSGHSECFGIVTFWDNVLTPMRDASGVVISIICVSRDITEKVLIEKKLEESLAREQILTFEMQHRIKNLFSVVSAVVMIAERETDAAGAHARFATVINEKLSALARSSDASFFGSGLANSELRKLVSAVLQPFGSKCRSSGCSQTLSVETANVLALCLHELATNSLKHGALSAPDGSIEVQWEAERDWLQLAWRELGGPYIAGPATKSGFGTKLIDRIIGSAGGSVVRNWFQMGLYIEIKIPLHR